MHDSPVHSPKVSVIMPAYNAELFIAKAIESVLAQDFHDWELIIVNDGSTDGTPEILTGLTDFRIRVIHQANGGEAVARNRGLDAVSGEYVAFLDADDLFLPNALEDLSGYLVAHEEMHAVCSDGYFCDANDRLLGRMSEVRPQVQPGNILEALVIDPAIIGPPIFLMVRRSCILEAQARFDPQLVIGPDWDFWIQLAPYARFGYLDRPTCMYRVHPTNITRTSGAQRRRADLVRGRLKVMKADWFTELSPPTRKAFFHNLLVNLLSDQPERQSAIIDAAPFRALSPNAKADLFRQMASKHLMRRQDTAFALDCLSRSLALQPNSLKARVLLELAQRSPAFAADVLAVWQRVHSAAISIRSIGQRKPKPVPAALVPRAE